MVHEVIDKLVAKNLVNVKDLLTLTLAPEKEGLWPQKIFFELQQRGIQEKISDKAIFNDSNDWQIVAQEVFSKSLGMVYLQNLKKSQTTEFYDW